LSDSTKYLFPDTLSPIPSSNRGDSFTLNKKLLTTEQFFRFVSKFTISDGCWAWTAALQKNGYGALNVKTANDAKKRNQYPHRVAYELFRGGIPDGFDVCHSCDNRRCVNPDHLFVGSRWDNMRDCKAKGRTRNQFMVKTMGRVV
jgi:hypothetical protein